MVHIQVLVDGVIVLENWNFRRFQVKQVFIVVDGCSHFRGILEVKKVQLQRVKRLI